MSKKVLANNAFWSLLSHVLSRGSLMLATIILARNFDASDFASYTYFQLTVSMLAAYAALGLGVTASKYFAEIGTGKAADDSPPLGTLWCLSMLVSIFASAVVMVIPGSWLSAGLDVPRWLLAAGILSVALNIVPNGAVLGLERYRQATIVSGVSGVLLLVGALVASNLSSPLIGMASVIAAALVQALGNSLVVINVVGWEKLTSNIGMDRINICRVLSFAGPMFFVSLMSASGAWLIGRFILNGQDGELAFAIYTIGLQWFSLGMLIPGMLSRVILPRLVKFTGSEESVDSTKQLVQSGIIMATGSALVVAAGGLIFGPWLLVIYGDNYQADRWIIIAYLVIAILLAPTNIIGNAIVANDGQMSWFWLTAAWLFVLIFVGFIFGQLGAWSGAAAHAASAAILALLSFILARKKGLL